MRGTTQSVADGIPTEDRGNEGKLLLVLDVGSGAGPGIALRNVRRSTGLMLGVSPDGLAGFGVMGEGGIPVLNLGMTPDGSALMAIHDTEGKELVHLPKP